MLFKAEHLFDDCVFSGKALRQSLPCHQLCWLTKGKCLRQRPHPDIKHSILLPGSSVGFSASPPCWAMFVFISPPTKTIQSLHQDGAGDIWNRDFFFLFLFFSFPNRIRESTFWAKTFQRSSGLQLTKMGTAHWVCPLPFSCALCTKIHNQHRATSPLLNSYDWW